MQIAKNTFTDGLVMDLSPDITQNTCLTNALNATYVTMNGNELQLQNDMGNAKFGAQLPAGYIPIGTTQIGGIIYVVSINPTTNKTQIGSFPSPQIQFTSSIDITESELDLKYFETNLQYKKIYNDVILQPGDKFVFYFPNEWKNKTIFFYNSEYFNQSDTILQASLGFIKYSICTVTQEGKLIELQNLRNQYYLPQDENKPTEDDYNVYNSSISGNLALVLTKVFCYNTNLQVLATDINKSSFQLQFTYTFASNDKFIPSYVNVKINNNEEFQLTYSYGDDQELPVQVTPTNYKWFKRKDSQLYKVSYSGTLEKSKFGNNLTLQVQPIKKIPSKASVQLANQTQQIIDLTKLGTSTIELTTYKYNINTNQIIINFAYLAYLQADEAVTGISVKVYTSSNNDPIVSQLFDTIDTSTYFMYIDMQKVGIKSNELYIVEFEFNVTTTDLQGTVTTRKEYVPRWLITEPNLFSESAQDYNEATNVYYWVSSKTETLDLGNDQVSADYSNVCSLSQNSNINIKETHQFKKANINTIYKFDSSVSHTSLGNINEANYNYEIPSNTSDDYIFDKSDNTEVTTSDLQLTFKTELDISVYYTIKGSRTQQIISKKNIMQPLFMAYPSKYSNYGHIALNNITKEQLDSGIFENAISNQPNIASIRITTEINKSLTLGEQYQNQNTVKGILIKGTVYGSTTDCCLLTNKDLMGNDGNEIEEVMKTITRNINVFMSNQDFTYYTLTNDYTVTHIDTLDINTVISFTNKNLPFLVKIGDKSLDDAMVDFQFQHPKPKNIKVNFIEDVTKTADIVTKQSKLPISSIDNYLSINAQTLLINASDNIISLYNTYESDTLYYIKDNIPTIFNSEAQLGNIKCDGSKFSISQGNLSITNEGTVYLNEQVNQELGVVPVTTPICPYNTTAIITNETTKTDN